MQVCAPLWKNQYYTNDYLLNGACYVQDTEFEDGTALKRLPLTKFSKSDLKGILHDTKFSKFDLKGILHDTKFSEFDSKGILHDTKFSKFDSKSKF